MDLGNLIVRFGSDVSGLAKGIDSSKGLLSNFGSTANIMGGLIGVALIGAGVAATKMAGDFQESMTQLVTGAGEAQGNLATVSQGILDMAVQTGTSTAQLAAGMYMVESAGFHGAAGLQILQAAAEGAKVGNADLGTVADATTTILKDFGDTGINASQAVNALVTTVSQGKTHMQDLATSLAQILPTASAAHVGLEDVMGAMATMTGEGVPAANAATYLRQTILALIAPSSGTAAALKNVGLTTQQVATAMQTSLPDALKMITDAVGKKFPEGSAQYVAALKAIAGGSKQMQGILDLTGSHMKDFGANVLSVGHDMANGKSSIKGWSDVQQDFNFKLSQAKEVVETLGIKLGTMLLPPLGNLLGVIPKVVQYVSDFKEHAGVLVPIIAGLIAAAVIPLTIAMWNLAAAVIAATWPFLLIAAAVAGAVAIFMHFYQTNTGFKQFIDMIVSGVKQAAQWIQANFVPALREIGTWIQTTVLPALERLGNWIQANVLPALEKFGDWLRTVVLPALQQVGQFLLSTFMPVWQQLVALWNGQLLPLFRQLWDALQQLMPVLKVIGAIVVGVLIVGFVLLVGVLAGVVKMIAVVIGDIASAIGGIVQIFTGIIQVVTGILRFIVDLVTGNWKDLGKDLQMIGQGIINIVGGVFQTLGSLIHAIFGGILAFIGGFVEGIGHFIGPIFSGLGTKVRDILTGIKNWVGNIFSQIGTKIHDALTGIATFFLSKWNDLVTFVKSIPGKIGAALATLAGVLLAPFKWFYDHNTYVKEAVDAIHQKLTDLKNLVGDIFNWIGSKIHDVLTFIKNIIGNDFNWIGSKIHDTLTTAKNLVGSIFGLIGLVIHQKLTAAKNFVGTIFSQIGTTIHDKLTDMKNFIGTIFSTIGTLMHDKLNDAWNNLVSFASGWPSQAFQWGVNLITGIINGLGSMLNAVKDKAGEIAGAIKGALGFHSPAKEGPGRDADTWAPNFMNMYIAGLSAGIPRIRALLAQAMLPMALAASGTLSLSTTSTGRAGTLPMAGMQAALASAGGGSGGSVIHVHNHVYLNGHEMTEQIMTHAVQQIRMGGIRR